MGELTRIFNNYKSDEGRLLHKLLSYAPIYEKYLEPLRGKEVNLVEIGILYGGCLQMWRDYLGEKCLVYGIDHAEHLLYEENRIKCFLGEQSDTAFLNNIHNLIPNIDIFIDDASHFSKHQIDTFEAVFPYIRPGGIYFCEDTHTSYRPTHEGGYLKEDTFIEFCKSLIDSQNYPEDTRIKRPTYIDSLEFITFYRSLVIIKKCVLPT